MIKKLLIAIILTTIFSNITAQKIVSGYLIDSLSNKPISNVQITNISTNEIIYAGYNGYFEINLKSRNFIILKFSHISYKNKIVKIPAGAEKKEIFLTQNDNNLDQIIVSTNRIGSLEKNQPYDFIIINKERNSDLAYSSIDDYLKYSSSINIIKPSGIYTHAPIITISGNGAVAGRTLVLFDGIHLNKSDDGNVNWNMFPSGTINRVEISHNPLSTLYGNNAFSGVINFIPELSNKSGFSGFTKINYGSLKTYNIELAPEYRHFGDKGIFLKLDAFAQKSDGYIQTPDSLQLENITYLPTYLQEVKANFIVGYDFNRNQKIELITNYFDDKRSMGIKIEEEDGSYVKHTSELAILKYSASFKKTNFGFNFFFQNENYFKNIESLKHGIYSLIYVNSIRQDAGTNLFFNHKFSQFYNITSGLNLQMGQVTGKDEYQTSTDIVTNSGKLFQSEGYLQNTIFPFKNNKLILLFGGNINRTQIISPTFIIENETSATDFMQDFTGIFNNNFLENFSFNSGLKVNINNNLNIFSSYNTGINSPSLEDLTRSGFMRLGFKLANPLLEPEKISNISAGLKYNKQKFTISANFNYNQGSNYMYYLETGEYLFGGSKKIVQKQNITNVTIYNSNINLNFQGKKYGFFTNYSYNKSFISKFDSIPDLVGKFLTYNPQHNAHAGINVKINNIKASLIANYYSKQFNDDYNTSIIPAYYTFDASVSADILSNLTLNFTTQNILNYQYVIYDNQLSIGRFLMFSAKFKF